MPDLLTVDRGQGGTLSNEVPPPHESLHGQLVGLHPSFHFHLIHAMPFPELGAAGQDLYPHIHLIFILQLCRRRWLVLSRDQSICTCFVRACGF